MHSKGPLEIHSDPCHFDTLSDIKSPCGTLFVPVGGSVGLMEQEDSTRLLKAAYNSYDKHCGERAVECAEADLLGQALEALQAARVELENEGARVPTKVTAVLAQVGGEG